MKSGVVWAVPVGTEHRVAITGGRAAGVFAACADKWIDVPPNDVLGGRDLENAARGAFANQGVAVRQSFRAADVVTEK